MPPGGQLFALLASVELADLDAEQALTYVAAMERMARHAEALRLAGLAQFADCNGVVAEPVLPGAAKLVHPGGDGTRAWTASRSTSTPPRRTCLTARRNTSWGSRWICGTGCPGSLPRWRPDRSPAGGPGWWSRQPAA